MHTVAALDQDGNLIITLTDGTVQNLGKIIGADGAAGTDGKDGADGKDGVGVKSTALDQNGNLIITLTNDAVFNLGAILGTDGKDGANGTDGKDGADGADGAGIAKIEKTATDGNVDTYTITLTNGQTYTFTVTNGVNGADGKDGLTPFIGENGNWWIGDTDTGVQAACDGSIPAGSGAVVENDGNNTITIIAIVIACLALASNLALVAWVITKKKKSLV